MEVKVTKNKVTIVNNDYIVNQGEYNANACNFIFSEEYTEDIVKKAIFSQAGHDDIEMVIINNGCDIPAEFLNGNAIGLGVYGYEVRNDKLILRYSPTPTTIYLRPGSYRGISGSGEEITPTQFEQYEQALHDGLNELSDKMGEVDDALTDIDEAITKTNNLDLDVSKTGKVATVTLTKKDASTKVVTLSDGTSLMFNWDGTRLGIKTDEDPDYTYVDLQGVQGPIGPQGEAFTIKKTYATVQLMIADYDNMQIGDYVMISGNIEQEDNAKLFTKTETEDPTYRWQYLADFSGATGIRGPVGLTPNIQIGNVVEGITPNVTRTGTNENPILNFTLVKGDKGDTGEKGDTGNGIESITKTSSEGLVDTYTILFTDGTTTTFDVTNGEVTWEQFDKLKTRVEDLETNQLFNDAEGVKINVDDAHDTRVYEFELEKESSQKVEPSPEYPQEVKTIKNNVNITICGKNLWSSEWEQGSISGSTGENVNSNNEIRTKDYIKVNPGQHYAINRTIHTNFIRVRGYDINKNFVGSGSEVIGLVSGSTANNPMNKDSECVIYSLANVYYLRFTDSSNDLATNYMMTKGDIQEQYEAYKEKIIPIPLNNNEVVGIGNLDELIVDTTGHVYLNKKTKKIILDGTQAIGNINTQQTNTTRVTYNGIIENGISGVLLLCNRLTRVEVFNSDAEGIYYNVNNGNLFFRINKTLIGTTNNEINTYLTNNNIILYYPTSESQLIDLQTTVNIKLFKGVNNITNSEDANMRIRYVESIESIINDFDTRLKALEGTEL